MCNIWQDNLIKLSRFLGWLLSFYIYLIWALRFCDRCLKLLWICVTTDTARSFIELCVCACMCACMCTVGGICVLLPFQYRYCFLVGNYARLLFCCFVLQSPSLWYFVFCDWHLYARAFSFFCLPNSKESARLKVVDMIPQSVICILFIYFFLWTPPPPLLSVC